MNVLLKDWWKLFRTYSGRTLRRCSQPKLIHLYIKQEHTKFEATVKSIFSIEHYRQGGMRAFWLSADARLHRFNHKDIGLKTRIFPCKAIKSTVYICFCWKPIDQIKKSHLLKFYYWMLIKRAITFNNQQLNIHYRVTGIGL